MIGSVSSGFRRRRPRRARRTATAATATPAGSPQPPDRRCAALPARCESSARSPDRRTWIACPPKLPRVEERTVRKSSVASGVTLATFATRGRVRTSACLPGVSDSDAADEVVARIVDVSALTIVDPTGPASRADAAGLSGALRTELPFASVVVAAGAAPTDDAGATTWAAAIGAVCAEPAAPTAADPDPGTEATAGSAADDGEDTPRGGNKVSGSTYPCGSLVVRAPKYT